MEKYYLYVVLTRTNTVISNLIKLIKKDEYTHAAISLDSELNSMYSFARKMTYVPFIGGFNKEEFNKGIYKFQKDLPGIIIKLCVTKEQYKMAEVLLEHFKLNREVYKYNYLGLLYSLLNRGEYCDHRFLCSEFVYYILNKSGIEDFKIPRNLVRPQNLLRLNGDVIYKGNLKAMKPVQNMAL